MSSPLHRGARAIWKKLNNVVVRREEVDGFVCVWHRDLGEFWTTRSELSFSDPYA